MVDSKLVKLLLVLVVVFVIYKVYRAKKDAAKAEMFDDVYDPEEFVGVEPFTAVGDSETLPPNWAPTNRPLPNPPPMSTAAQLLPKPSQPGDDDYSQFAPSALTGVNLLDATQQLGIDTQGSSLKLSSWDLRGYGVPNPRNTDTGPWGQSTFSADLLRKQLQ